MRAPRRNPEEPGEKVQVQLKSGLSLISGELWSMNGPQSPLALRQGARLRYAVSVSHWLWVVPQWGRGASLGKVAILQRTVQL